MNPEHDTQSHWTPYAELDSLLAALLAGVRANLGKGFAGLYLHGSLALGDFDPRTSDVDFLVVTRGLLPEPKLPELAALHARLRAAHSNSSPWAAKLEGSYIPLGPLRRFRPRRSGGADDTHFPALRVDGSFEPDWHGSEWILQSHILRERGIALAGPQPKEFMEPRRPEELRQAVGGLLEEWWRPQLEDPRLLFAAEYRPYAVLTMCRMHYTLQHGEVVSKPAAARWALAHLDERWRGLIAHASTWLPGEALVDAEQMLDFIRDTLNYARGLSLPIAT